MATGALGELNNFEQGLGVLPKLHRGERQGNIVTV